MALTKFRLGDLIAESNERNKNDSFSVEFVRGVASSGVFCETKANMAGVALSNYKIVKNGYFAYNPSRLNIGSISLNKDEEVIVSPMYVVFRVIKTNLLLPEYLLMYIRRSEFLRYTSFCASGSVRDVFDFSSLCDVDIEIPSLDIQQKYVDIYNAMLSNQKCYERGLEDLELICRAYIENLRKTNSLCSIGDYIEPVNEKNSDGRITLEQGVDINKRFITPQRSNSNLNGRKIVRHGQFAYCTQLNNENVAIAYRTGEDCVVSSVYDVFRICDNSLLLPEYLMLWLIRPEFGRFVYWASEGSAYEFLNYENLANYQIPVPDISIQKNISDIYRTLIARKTTKEHIKDMIKDLCPILIKGSLEEANK